MKIYGLDFSIPVLKVRYLANYMNLDYEPTDVNLAKGEGRSKEYLQKHPAGKIPVLEDGDFTLWESGAIIRYLARKENSSVYPEDIKAQAVVDQWLDFGSLHIMSAMGRVLFNKIMAPKFNLDVDEKSLQCGYEFLERFCPIVDEQLGKNTFLAGDTISLADFNMLAALDPCEVIEFDVKRFANIAKWRDELRQKDWYQKVHKFYGEAMMAQ